jgi:hypothetical protein
MCMIMADERSFVRIHHVAFHWTMGAGSHQSAGLGKASGYTRHMSICWERQSEELLVGSVDCKLLYLG